jgi:hypothetical protein
MLHQKRPLAFSPSSTSFLDAHTLSCSLSHTDTLSLHPPTHSYAPSRLLNSRAEVATSPAGLHVIHRDILDWVLTGPRTLTLGSPGVANGGVDSSHPRPSILLLPRLVCILQRKSVNRILLSSFTISFIVGSFFFVFFFVPASYGSALTSR